MKQIAICALCIKPTPLSRSYKAKVSGTFVNEKGSVNSFEYEGRICVTCNEKVGYKKRVRKEKEIVAKDKKVVE